MPSISFPSIFEKNLEERTAVLPPPSSAEPTFVRFLVLGGLNKNLVHASVNTFSEDFFAEFQKISRGKELLLVSRRSVAPLFRSVLRAGGPKKNFVRFSVNHFSENSSEFFRRRTAERTEALASFIAPRRRCFWRAVSRREGDHVTAGFSFKPFLKIQCRWLVSCWIIAAYLTSRIPIRWQLRAHRTAIARRPPGGFLRIGPSDTRRSPRLPPRTTILPARW